MTLISCRADISIPITQGTPAPFSGVLMDNEKANKVDQIVKDNVLYKQIMDNSNTILSKEQDKIQVLMNQNSQLMKDQSMTDLEKFLLFSLGVATAIGAGILVKNATQ